MRWFVYLQVRMANLAIIGSHAVNGVAAIHSELVKTDVFPGFYTLWPEKFQNKTNGITPRRWLNQANPALSAIISRWLDTDEWLKNLDMLCGLRPVADNETLQAEWEDVKLHCKTRLAHLVKKVRLMHACSPAHTHTEILQGQGIPHLCAYISDRCKTSRSCACIV
jgi:glucan phosphorylase